MKEKRIIFIMLVPFFLLLSNFLILYTFNLFNMPIYYSVFTFPFTYLFSNILTKLYGYNDAIKSILLAIVLQLLSFLISYLTIDKMDVGLAIASISSFTVSQAINLILYYNLVKRKKDSFIMLYISIIITILIDNFLFLSTLNLFSNHSGSINVVNLSNVIKAIIALMICLIGEKIKKKK